MSMSDALKRWNTRFSAPGYVFGTAPNIFLTKQKARLKRGQHALAIADGEARNGVWLAQQGLDVTSVDFSPVAVEKARKRAAEAGVTLDLVVADLGSWAWPKSAFDVVAGIFFQFASPDERAAIFRNIKAALKPGGLVDRRGLRAEAARVQDRRSGRARESLHRSVAARRLRRFRDPGAPRLRRRDRGRRRP